MPSLDETRQSLLRGEERVTRRANRFLDSFADFALQDNVLEIAVGLILGAAFTRVVTSFISDLLLPPMSLLPFLGRNLDERFTVLKKGPNFYGNGTTGYFTVAQANEDGAVIMSWGAFLNAVINFFGIGLALFALVSFYGWASRDPIIKHQVKCKYCRKKISEKAKRCINCTSWQDGREE